MSSIQRLTRTQYRTTANERKKRLAKIMVKQETLPPQKTKESKPKIKKVSFSEKFQASLDSKLLKAQSSIDIFNAYQSTLNEIIEGFPQYSSKIKKLTDGYDNLLKSLEEDIDIQQKKQNIVSESKTSFGEEIKIENLKNENQMEEIENLITRTKQVIIMLHGDIDDLKPQVNSLFKETKTLEFSISEWQISLTGAVPVQEKTEQMLLKSKQLLEQTKAEIESIYEEDLTLGTRITNVLDNINQNQKRIALTKQSIIQTQNNLSEVMNKNSQQNLEISNLKNLIQTTKEEINQSRQNLQDVISNKALLLNQLGILINSQGISLPSKISDDPERMLALYISFKNGYRNGIDPKRFPEYV